LMRRLRWALTVAVLVTGSLPCSGADSKYLLKDPAAVQRVDYLILAGDKFADHVDVLAAHREKQGHAVGVVKVSAAKARFTSIRAFLAHAVTRWKQPAPAFLLLVGDVDAVPAVVKKGALRGWSSSSDLATDFDYARPTGSGVRLHVGRFPCDTAEELAVMVRKTIAYETELPAGEWQHKLNLVASVGGYGKQIDSLLEGMAMAIASSCVPAAYDMQAAYGSPNSPYCPYPPAFNDHVLEMFNRGSLFTIFVGHGTTRGVARLYWKRRGYRIFSSGDAGALNCKAGLPILVVIACHTGRYDASDCLGETFFKVERGPVAFIGGSRVTQPYGNGLFAKALIDALLGKAKTLGEVVTQAKQTVTAHRFSLFRLQVDTVGGMMQSKESLGPMRKDVVEHYNLLGDPALVIRRPRPDIKLTVNGSTVRISAPGRAKVRLTLECDRLAFLHPIPEIDENDPRFREKITDRYRKAHDKIIQRWTVALKDGKGSVEFKLPKKPGRYFLKASVSGSVGSAALTVEPPKPPAP